MASLVPCEYFGNNTKQVPQLCINYKNSPCVFNQIYQMDLINKTNKPKLKPNPLPFPDPPNKPTLAQVKPHHPGSNMGQTPR